MPSMPARATFPSTGNAEPSASGGAAPLSPAPLFHSGGFPASPRTDDGACSTADHPGVECLRWMGLKIACGLTPDDPALLRRHQLTTEQLIGADVLAPVPAQEQALRLLYSAAHNPLLPWHWRWACLDQLQRPLAALVVLARTDDALAARVQRFQWCLSQSPLKES